MTARALLLVAAVIVWCGPSREADSPDGADLAEGPGDPGEAPAGDPASGDGAAILEAHNAYRKKHCAPPLVWADDLAKEAQAWADGLAKKGCKLAHSSTKWGENIAAATAPLDPARAVELWYQEIKDYDFKKGTFSMKTGHFTQVVWVGSRRIGCGTATCKGLQLRVCNYDPPGNMQGAYKPNVLSTTCK